MRQRMGRGRWRPWWPHRWSNRMREKVLTDRAPSTVAVVGLGKIGLPLATWYAMPGWRVIGCDINPHIVEEANTGISHVPEEPGLAGEATPLSRPGARPR